MVKDLEWGLGPPTERAIAWGARAIYTGFGKFDLLWDRMGMQGGTEEQRKQFGAWLDKKGLPALRELLKKEGVTTSEDRYVNLHLDGWFITANPRMSCGYLYIGAYPCDNGDPEYIPEPVDLTPPPPPAPPKKRTSRKRS